MYYIHTYVGTIYICMYELDIRTFHALTQSRTHSPPHLHPPLHTLTHTSLSPVPTHEAAVAFSWDVIASISSSSFRLLSDISPSSYVSSNPFPSSPSHLLSHPHPFSHLACAGFQKQRNSNLPLFNLTMCPLNTAMGPRCTTALTYQLDRI